MNDIEELIEMDEGRERELDETMYLNRDKDDWMEKGARCRSVDKLPSM